MDVPDTVAEAEVLEAELFAHTHSPEATVEYLHLIGVEQATARAAYAEARWGEARDDAAAIAAADAWYWANQKAGAVLDRLRAAERAQQERDRRGAIIFVDQTGPVCDGEHGGCAPADRGAGSRGEGEPDRPGRGRVGAVLGRLRRRGADAQGRVGVGAVHRGRGPGGVA